MISDVTYVKILISVKVEGVAGEELLKIIRGDTIDKNKDGKISMQELSYAVNSLQKAKESSVSDDATTDEKDDSIPHETLTSVLRLFCDCDLNKDGIISKSEFTTAAEAKKLLQLNPGGKMSWAEVFGVIEKNGDKDGTITFNEFSMAMIKALREEDNENHEANAEGETKPDKDGEAKVDINQMGRYEGVSLL
mmetsp:Transcript_31227/g.61141  ORF Transcript_31227/g.61141 Transcript_31227/m.61141 type:complete len:193 (-) Transcript_31227:243-821(-)